MASIQFDLVSPERNMASLEASVVVIPAAEGDMGVMAGHAPFIATLRPGVVRATTAGAEQKFVVMGGFVEVTPEAVTVLADEVQSVDEFDVSSIDARIAEAEQALGIGGDAATVELRAQRLSDLKTLKAFPIG